MKIKMKKTLAITVLTMVFFISFSFYMNTKSQENLGYRSTQWVAATTKAQFPGRAGHTCVVYKNQIFLAGGWDGNKGNNDVWSSKDGKNWTLLAPHAGFSPRGGHSMVVFRNKLWIIGGLYLDDRKNIHDLNDVWSSEDGVTWQEVRSHADFPSRGAHTATVYKGKLWIIGGLAGKGDVWSSTDGAHWTCATKSAPFNSRGGHSSVVFDGKLWVIGGMYVDDDNSYHSLNDLWYTTDGNTWTEADDASSFHAGGGHACISYNDMLWIIGGFRMGGSVYNSQNGTSWERIKKSDQFGDRVAHSCVVFHNKIWIIGGYDGSAYKNDVWRSEKSPVSSRAAMLY